MESSEEHIGKVRVYRKQRKQVEVEADVRSHPLHQPYRRDHRGQLRHSLMIDGLGEDYSDEDED